VAVSFKKDIQPLFTHDDIAHMKHWFDLSDKDDNVDNHQGILNRLQGVGGSVMPPPPYPRWTQDQINLYKQWIADGFAD